MNRRHVECIGIPFVHSVAYVESASLPYSFLYAHVCERVSSVFSCSVQFLYLVASD